MSKTAKRITVHEEKTHLSKLIERALRGEDVVVHRGDVAVVRLVPVKRAVPRRRFGAMKGTIEVPKSFFDPLPDAELAAWGRWVGVLLDTHVFLWWLAGDTKLSKKARALVASSQTECLVSAASAWEITTKVR